MHRNANKWIPLKKEIVAGVTVLTLGSGGSSFLKHSSFPKVGLLSMMATVKCFVNGVLAAGIWKSDGLRLIKNAIRNSMQHELFENILILLITNH